MIAAGIFPKQIHSRILKTLENGLQFDSGEVVVLDLRKENTTSKTTALVPIAGEPDVVWYNPTKNTLYCAIGNPGIIDVIDTNKMTLIEEVHTEQGTHTFAFDNYRQQLCVFLPHSSRAVIYEET